MGLDVHTEIATYPFDGPFEATSTLRKRSGVYVITTIQADGTHDVVDVGESNDIRERVENHDRQNCWNSHIKRGLFAAALYCDEIRRLEIEADIRQYFMPPCGLR